MRVIAKTGIAIVLCLLVGMVACGGSDDGGGGMSTWGEITGATSVFPGTRNLYSVDSSSEITGYQWSVEGNGTIIGSSKAGVLWVGTPADAGLSSFTVRVAIQVNGRWHELEGLEVRIINSPRFKLVLNTPDDLSPATITGSGIITMASNDASATTWSLYFEGNTLFLPQMVPVTVRTTNGQLTMENIWLVTAQETRTLLFPRAGGGSVGLGGPCSTPARPAPT